MKYPNVSAISLWSRGKMPAPSQGRTHGLVKPTSLHAFLPPAFRAPGLSGATGLKHPTRNRHESPSVSPLLVSPRP